VTSSKAQKITIPEQDTWERQKGGG